MKVLGSGWKYESFPEGTDDISNNLCGCIFRIEDGADLSFMTEGGKVARVEAPTDKVFTEKGLHIGSTEEDVRRAYGEAVMASPNSYEEAPAQYLAIWTKDGPKTADEYADSPDARGIRFTTSTDKKVQSLFGGNGTIQYIKGCA